MAKNVQTGPADDAAAKPKSKMKWILLLTPLLLVVGGGGAAGAYYFLQSDTGGKHEEAPPPVPLSYYSMEDALISNIADSPQLVQVKIAMATDAGPELLDGVKAHETAIRAELLTELMSAKADDLSSRAGKAALRAQMRDAVNAELKKRVGEDGITEVLFTDMVIQ
ncbi:flagellar basal body-associated FliL family protein [Pacificimonas sp. ICDLI1SI03]